METKPQDFEKPHNPDGVNVMVHSDQRMSCELGLFPAALLLLLLILF